MARPRRDLSIRPVEAEFILDAMYRDRVISSEQIAEYRRRFDAEVASLESRLAHLRALAGRAAPAVAAAAVATAIPAAARAVRRTRAARKRAGRGNDSPDRVASRQLQGRYLGLLRQIPRSVVDERFGRDAIRAKGKEAVVAEMQVYVTEAATRPAAPRKRRK